MLASTAMSFSIISKNNISKKTTANSFYISRKMGTFKYSNFVIGCTTSA